MKTTHKARENTKEDIKISMSSSSHQSSCPYHYNRHTYTKVHVFCELNDDDDDDVFLRIFELLRPMILSTCSHEPLL